MCHIMFTSGIADYIKHIHDCNITDHQTDNSTYTLASHNTHNPCTFLQHALSRNKHLYVNIEGAMRCFDRVEYDRRRYTSYSGWEATAFKLCLAELNTPAIASEHKRKRPNVILKCKRDGRGIVGRRVGRLNRWGWEMAA